MAGREGSLFKQKYVFRKFGSNKVKKCQNHYNPSPFWGILRANQKHKNNTYQFIFIEIFGTQLAAYVLSAYRRQISSLRAGVIIGAIHLSRIPSCHRPRHQKLTPSNAENAMEIQIS